MQERADSDNTQYLDGHVLIAMPGMGDPRFARSLVFLCSHYADGAMGLIVNKSTNKIVWNDLFAKLKISTNADVGRRQVHYGGPVDTGRGFVLHSSDYHRDDTTVVVDETVSMTATVDILHALAAGKGPGQAIVTLGYAGWAPGQLEAELQQNGWLHCAPDSALLFGEDNGAKWDRALAKIGVNPALLGAGGHA